MLNDMEIKDKESQKQYTQANTTKEFNRRMPFPKVGRRSGRSYFYFTMTKVHDGEKT